MPLRYPPEIVYEKFFQIDYNDKQTLKEFLKENFYKAYSDVKEYSPKDFKENPKFLNKIESLQLKQFAGEVNQIWKTLVKEFDHSFSCEDCFTSIKSKYPFVVPGGRFQEYYYWDNLWVLHGLIVSEMYQTAYNLVFNILDMIDQIGYMPNGSRIYYYNRTQPPVITQMVKVLYDAYINDGEDEKAQKLLNYSYTILKSEHEFFQRHNGIELEFDGQQKTTMNFYTSNLTSPRPESYRQDYELHLQNPQRDEKTLYKNLGAGAESGWDYSSRWFQDGENLGTINLLTIIPVDLNANMLKNEEILGQFAKNLGKQLDQQYFESLHQKRYKAINSLLFNEDKKQWQDYFYESGQNQQRFYASNYVQLINLKTGISDGELNPILTYLQENYVDKYVGGIPASEKITGQQWDLPNAWAPSQYYILEGLWKQPQNLKAQQLAKQISQNFLKNAFCSYYNPDLSEKAIYEKYNSEQIGQPGGAGEYTIQVGFGWTNGTILRILQKYPKIETPQCENNDFDAEILKKIKLFLK
ncbi:Six-hairpin glycosidase-like protein [Pseudocohnilembus persalinus]|uniref:Trehalase n=1 Tax=Pseudocohnilembus persalinus TaxID=266149 RepID=A0A0V0QKN9_PSEPJ|nr:Six-hairpin glycosidase-like protein [Pseudocohnilembus persalinus]|eukprot:KRX02682.1 Six-hairpin glycosidase-like protein [Pseudocohnilembus persalinus]